MSALPTDRPHLKHLAARACRASWCCRRPRCGSTPRSWPRAIPTSRPTCSSATRSAPRNCTTRRWRWPAGCRRTAWQRGDRVIVFMQNCPQYSIAVHGDPARRRGGGAGQPDEQGRRVRPLHHRLRRARGDHHRRPGRHRRAGRCAAAPRRSACGTAGDALHRRDARRAARAAPRSRRPRSCNGCAPGPTLPPRCTRWRDALAAGHAPRAHERGPDDMAVLPYTSGTTGAAQGLHPHPPHADAQRGRRRAVGARRARDRDARRGADVSHHRLGLLTRSGRWARRHGGADAALGPRARGAPDRAPQGLALDLHPDDDHRPVRQPQLSRASI